MRNQRSLPAPNGFSLVELMVVLFIIGLLATVVLINVLPSTDKARVVKAQSDIATLDQAMEMYRLDMGTYPGQGEGLAALKTPPANPALPQNYRTVMTTDGARFNTLFHGLLGRGVYIAPALYEAGFVSAAHSDDDIAQTVDAARAVFRLLARG